MKNQASSILTLAAKAAFVINLLTASNVMAQPPAQGPGAATGDGFNLPVSTITGNVKDQVQKAIDAENASLATSPDYRAFLTVSSPQEWPAYMLSTAHLDQPNEFYVHKPYIFTYTVTHIQAKIAGVWVPYPFDRTITHSISVDTTCNGWFRGQGSLLFTTVTIPPYLEGDKSLPEAAFGILLNNLIPSYVDSQIRQHLPSGSISTASGHACTTLGVTTKAQGFNFEDIITEVSPIPIHTTLTPQVTVQVSQVKRLTLHNLQGLALYNDIETPNLTLWADNSRIQLQLPQMVEGQVWMPQGNATVQTLIPGAANLLVLIGALNYDDVPTEDTGWVTFGKATNFGDGTQTFQIMKTWTELPMTKGGKPIHHVGAGYEVTVHVSVPSSSTTANPNTTTGATTH